MAYAFVRVHAHIHTYIHTSSLAASETLASRSTPWNGATAGARASPYHDECDVNKHAARGRTIRTDGGAGGGTCHKPSTAAGRSTERKTIARNQRNQHACIISCTSYFCTRTKLPPCKKNQVAKDDSAKFLFCVSDLVQRDLISRFDGEGLQNSHTKHRKCGRGSCQRQQTVRRAAIVL